MARTKKETVITKDRLARLTARKLPITYKEVKNAIDALGDTIKEILMDMDETYTEDNPKIIKVFEGVNIEAIYIPSHKRELKYVQDDNGDNLIVNVPNKVSVKYRLTQTYKDSITKNLQGNQ